MSHASVLSQETLIDLDGAGMGPTRLPGSFRLRKDLLSGSSEEGEHFCELPRVFGSIKAFQYLGFSMKKSQDLAERLQNVALQHGRHRRGLLPWPPRQCSS